jgi:hypothetical protein
MSFDWIDLEGGRGRASGAVLGVDDSMHETFEIQLGSHPGFYGTLKPRWQDRDLDIEIISFGYADQRNVGNPNPVARVHFSTSERHALERVITDLIRKPKVQKDMYFFNLERTRFTGKVKFACGWILGSE